MQSVFWRLACNFGVFLHGTELPKGMVDWSLTSLRSRVIKNGARVVRHARSITFQMAEVANGGAVFTRIHAASSQCATVFCMTVPVETPNENSSIGLSMRMLISQKARSSLASTPVILLGSPARHQFNDGAPEKLELSANRRHGGAEYVLIAE